MIDKNIYPSKNQFKSKNNPSFFYPSIEQLNHLIKPDFSSQIFKENNIIIKKSFKPQKVSEPLSPIKKPKAIISNPYMIKGKDLFGVKQEKNINKKLNFNYSEDKCNISRNNICKNFNGLYSDLYGEEDKDEFSNLLTKNKYGLKCKINNNRMENDYTIIKTIVENKFDAVYQVKENKTNKIYCIKRISEKSNKNNFDTLLTTLEDIQKENKAWTFNKTFCMKYIDYWIENNFNLNKNIYILSDYFMNGDIFDYLDQLEKKNYIFTSNFYWDMIFEMMMGLLYVHKKGYIHFDIKPTNYLIDNDGYIILNDFGLSHTKEELSNLKDIIEGDSKYISKELFQCLDNISLKNINNKTDIFSLGLTILEILAKIDLPSNGELWMYIRDFGGNFLKEKIFIESNIFNITNFFVLIKKMISPINERPSLIELIEETPELNKRLCLMEKNVYKKSAK